jgi:hypothetical protein
LTTVSPNATSSYIVKPDTTVTPFSGITVSDPVSTTETVTVQLGLNTYSYPYPYPTDLGTLTDPAGGGTYDAANHTFTETALVTGTPTAASQILSRLVYKPPALPSGDAITIAASVNVNNVQSTPATTLYDVTPPSVTSTVPHQPIANGATIRPFATLQLTDNNISFSAKTAATITLTDGGGATDADGVLSGTGLSRTGVGTYSIAASYPYSLQSYLQNLVFTPTVAASGTRTTNFELSIGDTTVGLATNDVNTSVDVISSQPPPIVAGIPAAIQTVVAGNAISPFNSVTVSDTSPNPSDTATLTVTGGGTLSGTGLTPGASGTYTVAATPPATLTAIIDGASFNPPALANGQPSASSTISLVVSNAAGSAPTATTQITETPPPVPPPGSNFIVADQTTGKQTVVNGDPYSGPVTGIAKQLVLITPDNLNITAQVPNVFIHSGAGTDAIDVSKVNGNNILDGSTGSNFLTGGTGADTFFLDDRSPVADVFSTIVNFHAGDNATIFGVNQTNFKLNTLDNQGAANAKGLDFGFSAAGHANANIVLAGYSSADLSNGRLTVTYGTTPDTPGVPGSQYMNIHGN